MSGRARRRRPDAGADGRTDPKLDSELRAIRTAALDIASAYEAHLGQAAIAFAESTAAPQDYNRATAALYRSLRGFDNETREQRARLDAHFRRLRAHARARDFRGRIVPLMDRLRDAAHPWPSTIQSLRGWAVEVEQQIWAAYGEIGASSVPVLDIRFESVAVGLKPPESVKVDKPSKEGKGRSRTSTMTSPPPATAERVIRHKQLQCIWADGWLPRNALPSGWNPGATELRILRHLATCQRPKTRKQIAAHLELREGTVGRSIGRLLREGLVNEPKRKFGCIVTGWGQQLADAPRE
jgi:hypothetical protein